jgi:hypothetical protein
MSAIFSKLQVADRADAIIRARDAGLGIQRGKLRIAMRPTRPGGWRRMRRHWRITGRR